MQRIHIVGRKNHGKTTLLVELIQEFRRRGVRVGSIKHSSHQHELDVPGKDSHRHRGAGADPAAIVTVDALGVFLDRRPETNVYARLAPLYADCELVLVEGDMDAVGRKVEVWRAALGGPCLAEQHPEILAVISDDRPETHVPVWSRSDVARLADHLGDLLR